MMLPSATAQWMTPLVPNGGRAVSADTVASKGATEKGKRTVRLESQVRHIWTTPQAHDVTERGSGQKPTSKAGNACLARDARTWATPDCNTSTYSNGRMGPNIREQASNWTMPTATERSGQGERNKALTLDVKNWPTPASRDSKGENSETHATLTGGGRKHMDQLPNFVAYSPLAQAINDGRKSSPSDPTSPRRRLNPMFAEWLMGWPPGWTIAEPTACGALEMASYRRRLDLHLSSLLDDSEFREAA